MGRQPPDKTGAAPHEFLANAVNGQELSVARLPQIAQGPYGRICGSKVHDPRRPGLHFAITQGDCLERRIIRQSRNVWMLAILGYERRAMVGPKFVPSDYLLRAYTATRDPKTAPNLRWADATLVQSLNFGVAPVLRRIQARASLEE